MNKNCIQLHKITFSLLNLYTYGNSGIHCIEFTVATCPSAKHCVAKAWFTGTAKIKW